jgi:hypothetical protein
MKTRTIGKMIGTLAFALGSWLPNEVSADELKEAKVTQVIQDVRVLPSNASPRPAAVNDNVHQGTAVQTGVQSKLCVLDTWYEDGKIPLTPL